MVNLKFSIDAVAPMLLIVLAGYLLQKRGTFSKEFCALLNRLNFDFFLPVMLYFGIYSISTIRDVNWGAVAVCVFGIFVLFGLGYLLQLMLPDRRQKGVLWQCVFRSNFALIGLPLAQAIGGNEALAFASVISAFVQLSYNLLAVIALTSVTGESRGSSIKGVFKKLAKNPMVIASVAGILTLLIRMAIPHDASGALAFSISEDIPALYKALSNASKVASPLALVTLGLQFSIPKARTEIAPLTIGVVARLAAAPAIGILLAVLSTKLGIADFGTSEYPAVIALFGTPVGVSSVVLVQSMDGDVDLANRLVVFTSLLSAATLIALTALLKQLGFI